MTGPNDPACAGPAGLLPTVSLGAHRVTRLIAGWNPIGGYSHLSDNLSRDMESWFTAERIVPFLESLRANGINAQQFDPEPKMLEAIDICRERGIDMKLICLQNPEACESSPAELVDRTGAVAILHHGGVTDRLFREGQAEQVREWARRARDSGALVGVSTHKPDNARRIVDDGWDVDLLMTCFYYLTRTDEEVREAMPVDVVMPEKPYLADDPARMAAVVRDLPLPCLAFKILAAGRISQPSAVREAFRFALESIKPTDAVIVGMYPRWRDEVALNAETVRRQVAGASGGAAPQG